MDPTIERFLAGLEQRAPASLCKVARRFLYDTETNGAETDEEVEVEETFAAWLDANEDWSEMM